MFKLLLHGKFLYPAHKDKLQWNGLALRSKEVSTGLFQDRTLSSRQHILERLKELVFVEMEFVKLGRDQRATQDQHQRMIVLALLTVHSC